LIQGVVEAASVEALVEDLRNVRYTVTNIKQQSDLFYFVRAWRGRMLRVSLWSMVLFTRQFATIFNSGVPLLRGLEGLSNQTLNKRLSMALTEVYADVKNGMTIARSLGKHPDVFSPVYVALVRAGEMSGALGEILDRTADFLERDFQLRKKVQSAMTYPALVFFFTILVTSFMVLWVFPTFVGLLDGLNITLPWPTRILIFITEVAYNPLFILAAPIAVIFAASAFKKWVSTRPGKRALDQFLVSAPIVGPINRKVVISRFCRTLSTLVSAGVPMMNALDIVGKVSGNELVADIVDEIKRGVKAGLRLSQPLREFHFFPPIVPHMVRVGEETGNLPEILHKLANFYDNEIEAALSTFSSVIEPVLIIFMGAMVGFVLLAVFLPVYQIMQNFSS